MGEAMLLREGSGRWVASFNGEAVVGDDSYGVGGRGLPAGHISLTLTHKGAFTIQNASW